ncbi:MAG: hypothetical protein ACFFA3_09735 [Promethearchaeota archaeon]
MLKLVANEDTSAETESFGAFRPDRERSPARKKDLSQIQLDSGGRDHFL